MNQPLTQRQTDLFDVIEKEIRKLVQNAPDFGELSITMALHEGRITAVTTSNRKNLR